MKIYVASSWRNIYQPQVVTDLRAEDYLVYDFRNPSCDDNGFHWSEIHPDYKNWQFSDYLDALKTDVAVRGYNNDMQAMITADVCVLVLPCGKSAHLELGWFVGQGKPTCILLPEGESFQPELMTKMCNEQVDTMSGVIDWLGVLSLLREQ